MHDICWFGHYRDRTVSSITVRLLTFIELDWNEPN